MGGFLIEFLSFVRVVLSNISSDGGPYFLLNNDSPASRSWSPIVLSILSAASVSSCWLLSVIILMVLG